MRAAFRRLIHATAAIVAMAAAPAAAQDKPVHIIDTDPEPARIEDGIFFQQTGLVTLSVRNRHTSSLFLTVRAWVFTNDGRFRGTQTLCVSEPLDRGTRRISSLSLEVKGFETSDVVAVAVVRADGDRQGWTMGDAEADASSIARSHALGRGGRLRLLAAPSAASADAPCECDMSAAAASCDTQCAETGLGAFTSAPTVYGGCSSSCSCK